MGQNEPSWGPWRVHSKLGGWADRNLMKFSKKCRVLYLGLVSSMGWISKITASKCRNGIIPLGTHKATSEITVLWFWVPSTQRKVNNRSLFKLYTCSIVSLNFQEQYIFYIQKKAFLSYNNSHLPKVNIQDDSLPRNACSSPKTSKGFHTNFSETFSHIWVVLH